MRETSEPSRPGSDDESEPAPPVVDTGLICLVGLARFHKVATSTERLRGDYGLATGEVPSAILLRIARDLGFKAQASRSSWGELAKLQPVMPVIARLSNGHCVVVVSVQKDGQRESVGVNDPLASSPGVLFVERAQFESAWSGELLLMSPGRNAAAPPQPFGLRWFLPDILREKKVLRDVALAALALYAAGLGSPIFFQLVIDKVLVHQTESTLTVLTGGIVLVILFEALFTALRQYLLLFATNRVDIRLATRTFRHLMSLPIPFFEAAPSGVIVRNMQQVDKIRRFLTGRLFTTALDSIALVLFLGVLFAYSVKLTLIVLGIVGLIALVMLALLGLYRHRLVDFYKAEGDRQAMLVETVHGMRTVKALAIETQQSRIWDSRAAASVNMQYRIGKISMTAQALTGALEKLCPVAIITVGAFDVFDHTMTVGALIAFQMLSGRVISPLVQLATLIHEYQETVLSVRLLGQVMDAPSEQSAGRGRLTPHIKGEIRLEDVSFRYGPAESPALDRVSLTIPAGSVVGLVGRSGSGKTTLTRLLQGLYPVQEGSIRIDGEDLRNIDIVHLRRNMGIVLQDSFLFRSTIRENISVAKPAATFEEVVGAARLAGAEEFISRRSQGYDTPLEENAADLSGGQKQRLAIARTLITDPRILILDEATSALDPESEAIFLANLARIASGRTVVIVSHRLSMLVDCSQIFVLDRGQLAEAGDHRALLQRDGLYAQLWKQQMRGAMP